MALPAHLCVTDFAEARAIELNNICKNENIVKSKHIRRRTNAYRSYSKTVAQRMAKPSKDGVLQKTNKRPRIEKELCRKDRRKRSILRISRMENIDGKAMWLPTHLWQAKRMVMDDKWGYCLPIKRCDKSISAAITASRKTATVYDYSYCGLMELKGSFQTIVELLKTSSPPGEMEHFTAQQHVCEGQQHFSFLFYESGEFPLAAIGPVQCLWQPSSDPTSSSSCLWMWVHAASYTSIWDSLNANITEREVGIELHDLRTKFSRIQVVGKQGAYDIVRNSCQPLSNSTNSEWWKSRTHFSQFKDKAAFSLQITDVRVRSKKMPYENSISRVKKDTTALFCPLTGREVEGPSSMVDYTTNMLHDLREWANSPTQEYNTVIQHEPATTTHDKGPRPIKEGGRNVFLSTPISTFTQDHILNDPSNTQEFLKEQKMSLLILVDISSTSSSSCTWDIIVPIHSAPSMFQSLVFSGARAIGLAGHEAVQTAHKQLSFPRDFPDTKAGESYWQHQYEKDQSTHLAKPKAKRTNFNKLHCPSPFQPKWTSLWTIEEDSDKDAFCVLRGASFIDPFPFSTTQIKSSLQSRTRIPLAMSTLLPVFVCVPGRGRPQVNAMICLPTQSDQDSFTSDITSTWQGTTLQTRPFYSEESNREQFGYVTSAEYDKSRGMSFVTAYVCAFRLQNLFVQDSADTMKFTQGFALLRNPSSLQFRPVHLEVHK